MRKWKPEVQNILNTKTRKIDLPLSDEVAIILSEKLGDSHDFLRDGASDADASLDNGRAKAAPLQHRDEISSSSSDPSSSLLSSLLFPREPKQHCLKAQPLPVEEVEKPVREELQPDSKHSPIQRLQQLSKRPCDSHDNDNTGNGYRKRHLVSSYNDAMHCAVPVVTTRTRRGYSPAETEPMQEWFMQNLANCQS